MSAARPCERHMQPAQPQARWLYPAEIERVLAAHPAVALVAVGRQPDPVKGEIANAYVVLKKGAACDEARNEFCRKSLAAYKCPRAVQFVGAKVPGFAACSPQARG